MVSFQKEIPALSEHACVETRLREKIIKLLPIRGTSSYFLLYKFLLILYELYKLFTLTYVNLCKPGPSKKWFTPT